MKITVLGSCRQYSISHHFQVSSIQEQLTFPHYTKEVIQAIQYCKGNLNSPYTHHMFRTGILRGEPIQNREELMKEYAESDVIVVEIASRIAYKWNDVYLHHIITEEKYNFYDRHNIVEYKLTDEEIEEDLIQIKELVYPKKLLVVSHIYTYSQGLRYELIQLLQKLCLTYSIPFFSPSEYLYAESDVYIQENILAHYTDKGHALIGSLYKTAIQQLFTKKTLVYVIKQQYANLPRTDRNNFWGIGDMVRWIYGMYKKAKVNNYELIVDLSLHPLSAYIMSYPHKYSSYIESIADKIPFVLSNEIDAMIHPLFQTNDALFIGADIGLEAYMPSIYDTETQLVVKRYIRPNAAFMAHFTTLVKEIDLSSMTVVHYRLGDDELVRNCVDSDNVARYVTHFEKYVQQMQNVILLSDSSLLRQSVKERQLAHVFDHEIGHIGYDSCDKIKNAFFEFVVLQKVKQITSFSVYNWASGFVTSVHKVYQVPLISYMEFK